MSKYKNITISKISNRTPMQPTKQQIVYGIYSNEELVSMTKELTGYLRKNRTSDWQKKESARAGMRRMMNKRIIQQNQPKCMRFTRTKHRWLQNYRINLLK